LKINKKISVISLFSGCGGMDLGFEGNFKILSKSINPTIHPDWLSNQKGKWITLPRTIFETVFANDIFPAAKASWIPYFSKFQDRGNIFFLDSIVDLVKREKNGEKIFPMADVITGGFPCQDFSVAGKRKGFNSSKAHNGDTLKEYDDPTEENRGKLYMWMKHVIEIVYPRVFIAENVKGLVSLLDTKQIIQNDFRNIGAGYLVVDAKVLNAADYGVPQGRERVIFIGLRKDALNKEALEALRLKKIPENYIPYPLKTHTQNNENFNLLPYVTTKDYLEDLPEPEHSIDPSQQAYSKAKWYGKHCQGQAEINLNGVGPTIRSEHHGNIEFRRLSKENGGKYICELNKGLKERRLTVRECARIQTFPDDFEFVRSQSVMGKEYKISASEGYKLIGNAVPPLLAFHIAWRLQKLWPILFKSES